MRASQMCAGWRAQRREQVETPRLCADGLALCRDRRFHSRRAAARRAGGGLRVANSNPMLLEDVAIDFPDIQIVIAQPAVQPVSAPIRVNNRTPLTGWSSASSISWFGAAAWWSLWK